MKLFLAIFSGKEEMLDRMCTLTAETLEHT
jgi:hypothetical protein